MGGVPRNPKMIEGWLRSKAGVDDVFELRQMMLRTLIDSGVEVDASMTYEQIVEATEKIAGSNQTSGFKRGQHGLFLESRQVKSMLRESVNILYPGETWGATTRKNAEGKDVTGYRGKGAKNYFVERVFVSPDCLWLGRTEPDGVEMIVGHVMGPQGPRSTLSYHEYVERPSIVFDVLVMKDLIEQSRWMEVWQSCQENGLGALRSQGYGRFDIQAWDRVSLTDPAPYPD